MASKDCCEIPFLQDSVSPPIYDSNDDRFSALARVGWKAKLFLACFYMPAILLYLVSYFQYFPPQDHRQNEKCIVSADISSPVFKSDAIQYETKTFLKDFRDSAFGGDPSPELDLAWHNLFEDNNIKVEKEDLEIVGLKSIELADGGYLAQLNVFHELHCLKKIRHWIFKNYYVLPKNYTTAEMLEWPAHINHCIDMLRESIMCHGDTNLVTFSWIGDQNHRTPTPWDRSPHKCVEWDSLTRWTKERSVNIGSPGIMLDEEGKLYPKVAT